MPVTGDTKEGTVELCCGCCVLVELAAASMERKAHASKRQETTKLSWSHCLACLCLCCCSGLFILRSDYTVVSNVYCFLYLSGYAAICMYVWMDGWGQNKNCRGAPDSLPISLGDKKTLLL